MIRAQPTVVDVPLEACHALYKNYTDVIHPLDLESEQVYTENNGFRVSPTSPRSPQLSAMRARVGFAATDSVATRVRSLYWSVDV